MYEKYIQNNRVSLINKDILVETFSRLDKENGGWHAVKQNNGVYLFVIDGTDHPVQ